MLVKKQDYEGILVTAIVSLVNSTYKSSDHITLIDTKEAVRLASMEDQAGNDDGHIIDSDERENEPAEENT